jgi:hypothetical protein
VQHFLLGDPASPLRLIVLGAVILHLPDYLGFLLFGGLIKNWVNHGITYAYFLAEGCLAWACIRWLNPVLERRGLVSMPLRLSIGVLTIALGTAANYGVVYLGAFPLLMGRPVNTASIFPWWFHATALTTIVYVWLLLGHASESQASHIYRALRDTDQLATDLAQAELAMVEAQIEPHFLFNTLAHVKRQYRLDPIAANHMLSALIEYLDRALPALQRTDWTVGDELDLVQVYLEILAQRFGERLRFEITAPQASKSLNLPALTIATLVENAVRHGLTPKAGGGTVSVEVNHDTARLEIQVRDDGIGLRQASGSGLGLASVRARLKNAFGERARLAVEPRSGGGVLASIHVAPV